MYQRILVPTDGSPTANQGLAEACKLARALDAEIRILYVIDNRVFQADFSGFGNVESVMQTLREGGEAILASAAEQAARMEAKAHVRLAEAVNITVANSILQEVGSWPADLIVMGTHGRQGLSHLLMGSEAETVLRTSPVPVLLIRRPA